MSTDMKAIAMIAAESLRKSCNINEKGTGINKGESRFPDLLLDDTNEALNKLIDRHAHFPPLNMTSLLILRSEKLLQSGKIDEAALTLLHSQAISFHHRAIHQYSRRIEKTKSSSKPDQTDDTEDEIKKRILTFHSILEKNQQLETIIDDLPPNWTVLQITAPFCVATRFKKTKGDKPIPDKNLSLLLTYIKCGAGVCSRDVCRIPAPDSQGQSTYFVEFDQILALHKSFYTVENKPSRVKYSNQREDLDNRLKLLLHNIENEWLGYAKIYLQAHPTSYSIRELIDKLVDQIFSQFAPKVLTPSPLHRLRLSLLIDGAVHLSDKQLNSALFDLLDITDFENRASLMNSIRKSSLSIKVDVEHRQPLVLILDREIQSLPWESLPLLRPHPVTRSPSLAFLYSLYETHRNENEASCKSKDIHENISPENIFYVLNPDANLTRTEKILAPAFEDLHITSGVSGNHPTLTQVQKALTEGDAYLYCGHGSGKVSLQEIERLRVRAAPMLFGCYSGRLERLGRSLDPLGTAHSYLIASSPRLLGFLWSVTDKDIDSWTVGFLRELLSHSESGGGEGIDFVRLVANRKLCFQRFINSAATVVYGLPTM